MTVVLVISGNSVNCEQVKDILTNNSAEIDFSAPTPDSPQSQDIPEWGDIAYVFSSSEESRILCL